MTLALAEGTLYMFIFILKKCTGGEGVQNDTFPKLLEPVKNL